MGDPGRLTFEMGDVLERVGEHGDLFRVQKNHGHNETAERREAKREEGSGGRSP